MKNGKDSEKAHRVFTQFEPNGLETIDARGNYITLRNTHSGEQRDYLDFNSGYWCVPLGHRNNEVRKVFGRGYYAKPFGNINPHSVKCAEKLCDLTGGSKVLFSTTGSEAVDDAIRLAWQSRAKGSLCNLGRKYVLSLKRGYHGSTGLAMYIDGFPRYDSYLPMISDTEKEHFSLKLPDPSRFKRNLETLLDRNLKQKDISRDSLASVIFEPFMGARGGAQMPDQYIELFKKLQDEGVVIIADEVTTGLGRTGKMFGYQHYDIRPDLIAIGKGITNGEFPFAATVLNDRVLKGIEDSQEENYGKYLYGHTYSGHPTGSMMASKVLEIIERKGLLEDVRKKGNYLKRQIESLEIDQIKSIRGRGLFLGLEFNNADVATRIQGKLLDRGIFTNPEGNTLMLVPPYTIKEKELNFFIRSLRESLR